MKRIGFPQGFDGEIYVNQTASSCEVVFDNGHLGGTIVYPEVDQEVRDQLESVLNTVLDDLAKMIDSGSGQANFDKMVSEKTDHAGIKLTNRDIE